MAIDNRFDGYEFLPEDCPECGSDEVKVVDYSFAHAFGTEHLWHLECRACGHEWGGGRGRPPR